MVSREAIRSQQEEELKTMAEEIRKQWEEVQQQYAYLSRIDENMNFTIQMPAVIYSSPKEHSYSFEFSEKPRIKVVGALSTPNTNTPNACAEVRKKPQVKEDLSPVEELHREVIMGCPSAPKQPAKQEIKTKRLTIVHI